MGRTQSTHGALHLMLDLVYIQHGLTDAKCWEETRPDPEGAKLAKGEQGGERTSWGNGMRHNIVQWGRRGQKASRRRKRQKEDTTQSRVRSPRGGREGELRTRKPATFLEEHGLSRYEEGKEIYLSEGRDNETWEGVGNALGTNELKKRRRAQGHKATEER
ncbi:hypothetical protein NDU88_005404 [Pleurodeles waltl]|uniref:Uncharacterized protein n=1 Tax=Pleurodeles waltl TaxID=8319 RepID=A0AAV7LU05_PLEWA|nr:hypothetical protein NDU88_005404 [Pleurodeles waltl]